MHIEYQGIQGTLRAMPQAIFVADIEVGDKIHRGIIIPDDNGNERGIRPRWGQVVAAGDESDVKPGEWVLIEHGRWTWGLEVLADGQRKKIHGIDPKSILLVTDEAPQVVTK